MKVTVTDTLTWFGFRRWGSDKAVGWDWQQAGNGEEAGAAAGRAGGAGSKAAAPEEAEAAAGHRRSAGSAPGLVLPLMMCSRRVRACMDMDMDMDMDGRDGACQDRWRTFKQFVFVADVL